MALMSPTGSWTDGGPTKFSKTRAGFGDLGRFDLDPILTRSRTGTDRMGPVSAEE